MLSEIKQAEITPQAEAMTTAPVEAEKPDATTTPVEGEQEGKGKEHTLVSHAALHQEREARKAAARDAQESKARLAQLEAQQAQRDHEWAIGQQRLQAIAQRLEQQNAPAMPDREQDPIGYQTVVAERTAQQVEQMRREQYAREQMAQRQQQEWQQANQQQAAVQWFTQTVQGAEAAFSKEHPDYQDSVTYAVQRRAKELRAAGFPPEQASQIAANDARSLAAQWVQRGQNPAEMAYSMAQAMGYTPKTVDDETKAEMREQGMQATKPTGGGTSRGKVGPQQLAGMSLKQMASLSEDDFRAAMGG